VVADGVMFCFPERRTVVGMLRPVPVQMLIRSNLDWIPLGKSVGIGRKYVKD